jgi:molybdate transport system permease protein
VSTLTFLSPGELEALRLTLRVAAWNLAIGLPLAVAVAWLLARRQFWGKELLNALVHLPLILPPVVTGYILLILLGRRGPLGELLESWFGVVVAFR